MILYISGFGSSYKPFIQPALEQVFGGTVGYYLLKNVFSEDQSSLSAIVQEAAGDVRVIGHSTGGFHGLCLRRLHPEKVIEVHAINPAFDLLFSLDRNAEAADFLKERPLIKANFEANLVYADAHGFPVTLYQGRQDDRVDIPYNQAFTEKNGGKVFWFDIGHRFTEAEFREILALV